MSGVLEKIKGWVLAEEEEEEEIILPGAAGEDRPKRRPFLALHQTRQDEIFLRRPRSLEDAQVCADCLKARRPVVVTLKSLDEPKARRVLDFLSGVVYAIDGHMQVAGEGVYVLTPGSMSIAAEVPSGQEDAVFWGE